MDACCLPYMPCLFDGINEVHGNSGMADHELRNVSLVPEHGIEGVRGGGRREEEDTETVNRSVLLDGEMQERRHI
jgi:hypothetical protein